MIPSYAGQQPATDKDRYQHPWYIERGCPMPRPRSFSLSAIPNRYVAWNELTQVSTINLPETTPSSCQLTNTSAPFKGHNYKNRSNRLLIAFLCIGFLSLVSFVIFFRVANPQENRQNFRIPPEEPFNNPGGRPPFEPEAPHRHYSGNHPNSFNFPPNPRPNSASWNNPQHHPSRHPLNNPPPYQQQHNADFIHRQHRNTQPYSRQDFYSHPQHPESFRHFAPEHPPKFPSENHRRSSSSYNSAPEKLPVMNPPAPHPPQRPRNAEYSIPEPRAETTRKPIEKSSQNKEERNEAKNRAKKIQEEKRVNSTVEEQNGSWTDPDFTINPNSSTAMNQTRPFRLIFEQALNPFQEFILSSDGTLFIISHEDQEDLTIEIVEEE